MSAESGKTINLDDIGTEFLLQKDAPLQFSQGLTDLIHDSDQSNLGKRIEQTLQRSTSFGEDLKFLSYAWPQIKDILNDNEKIAIITVVIEVFFSDGLEVYYKMMIEFALNVIESISDADLKKQWFGQAKAMMARYQDDSIRGRFSRVAQAVGIEFEV